MPLILIPTTGLTDEFGQLYTGGVRVYLTFETGNCCVSGCNGSYIYHYFDNGNHTYSSQVSGYVSHQLINPTISVPENVTLGIQFVRTNPFSEKNVCKCVSGDYPLGSDNVSLEVITTNLQDSQEATNAFLRTQLATCQSQLLSCQTANDAYVIATDDLVERQLELQQQVTELTSELECCRCESQSLTELTSALEEAQSTNQILLSQIDSLVNQETEPETPCCPCDTSELENQLHCEQELNALLQDQIECLIAKQSQPKYL